MRRVALYIHWPFCVSKCPYCDFNSHVSSMIDHDSWSHAYLKSMEHFSYILSDSIVTSIFIGGGTPSLMHPKIVEKLINYVTSNFSTSCNLEITLEANPTSSCYDKFQDFKSAGVNRLSIGVQSFDDKSLKILGRNHSADEAMNAISFAQKIFPRFSFDLIYALPNQTIEEWAKELDLAISYNSQHLSLYQLTIEKGTPFYKAHKNGTLIMPEGDISADMYIWTNKYLQDLGYNAYEISNYAKNSAESIHNLSYWNYEEYLGIGPGAHSRLHGSGSVNAIMNFSSPQKWLQEISLESYGVQQSLNLSLEEVLDEIMMMGLRLSNGISDSKLKKILNIGFDEALNIDAINQYKDLGLVQYDGNRVKLTAKGLLLHSYITPRLISNK